MPRHSRIRQIRPLLMILATVAILAGPSLAMPGDRGCDDPPCAPRGFDREDLGDGIAHYQMDLRVGGGRDAVVGLHRVVAERAPFRPQRSRHAVFMVHGDAWTFEGAFLDSLSNDAVPDGQALPIFLAQNGVDVWGIDLRWTRVPADAADLSLMADWNLGTDVRDVRRALAVARRVRGLEGNRRERLHLLGWSRGGMVGYGLVNAESQLRQRQRHVRGFIPVDIMIKTDDPALADAACARAAVAEERLAVGDAADATGLLVNLVGQAALAAPDAPQEILPLPFPLTNAEFALFLGTSTFNLADFVPFYHFTGGTDDLQDLVFTQADRWTHFLLGTAPFEPVGVLADGDNLICDQADLPYDDHLDDVKVPVLYVGGGGGFGEFGLHSLTFLGSADVSSLVIDQEPEDRRLFDFGHADLFLADAAEELVWRPLLEWILNH